MWIGHRNLNMVEHISFNIALQFADERLVTWPIETPIILPDENTVVEMSFKCFCVCYSLSAPLSLV